MCKEGVLKFKTGDLVCRTDGDVARRCGLVLSTYYERSAVLWLNGLFKGKCFCEPNKRLGKLEVESV